MPRLIILFACGVLPLTGKLAAAEPVSFRQDLAPLLLDQCLACHGARKAEGGFRVDSYERLMQEGDSGVPGFESHDLEMSEAVRRMASDDPYERMPLDAEPVEKAKIELFERWVAEGATFDGEDPTADLVTVVPAPIHPAAPEEYPSAVPITGMMFGPDGNELIVGGYHELTVWDAESGSLLRRIENVGQRTHALSLSPDGELLAVGCGAPGRLGETRLFRVSDGELICSLGSTSDEVLDVVFHPYGDRLAAGGADGVIRVFAIPGGEELLRLTSHSDFVMAIAWSGDGSKLASGSRDKTAKVFDAQTGEMLTTYSGHAAPVTGVAFHPRDQEVISGGADSKTHRWKVADASKVAEVGFGGEILELIIDGELMCVASTGSSARTFDAKTQKPIHAFDGHQDRTTAMAYHAGTKRLASGGMDGSVMIWHLQDAKEAVTFIAAPGLEASQAAR